MRDKEYLNENKIFTLEDFLVNWHSGPWYTWTDSKNKVYENLICKNHKERWKDVIKPTKKECEDGIKKLQADYDSQKYKRDRFSAYPSILDQLDKIYHSGIDEWKKDIKAVKDKFPKPE
tara:strand:- start:593 stop:949 length:357 start_codon:yes stop_codon:yes gene_type:complete